MKADSVQVLLAIPELSISYRFTRPLVSMNGNILEASLVIPNGSVERWWPNGHGKQKLYDLTATLFYKGLFIAVLILRYWKPLVHSYL